MTRRFMILLASLMLIFSMMVPSAQARDYFTDSVCWNAHDTQAHTVCAVINVKHTATVNMHINEIDIECYGPYNNPVYVDGHELKLTNYNNVTKFSRGEGSDVDSTCWKAYYPDLDLVQTTYITLSYDFTPNATGLDDERFMSFRLNQYGNSSNYVGGCGYIGC